MKTCYDCIHCEACSDAGDEGFSSLKEDVSKCKHFKNKADFVEVVRCRNCAIRGKYKCPNLHFSDITGDDNDMTEDDDFCSYGERKIETDNTYFTPEDVVKMSEAEVKENYQTIMKSMDKWGGKDT